MLSDITVNGESIPKESILEEMQYHPAEELPWKVAADALVIRCLLLQEAKRLNIQAEPRKVGPKRYEIDEEAKIRALLESRVSVSSPDEETCRHYYEEHRERFHSPDLYEPRHILYAADPDDAIEIEAAFERARIAIDILKSEPNRFDEIARRESDCTSRDTGGHLGQIGIGQTVPEFEEVIRDLQHGEMHPEPVRTCYGAHVVRMERCEKGRLLPFESVRAQVRGYLADREWTHAVRSYIRSLTERAMIVGWQADKP